MLCKTCQRRSNCIPAALAADDHHMYALLERLKQCDRYAQEAQGYATLPSPQHRPPLPIQHPA
ncbi:MAG: hypothetical protein F6J95_017510 [Leptolyngbya sp. SIO1E4]|nr:hypothetical protein [Leptolyngbya sp. SIO1E4]